MPLKPQTLYPILARLLVYTYSLNAFAITAADTDLWGHLRFGQEHWDTGTLARIDPYSYTAAGHTWINHEWLTEWLLYGIYSTAGSTGLLVFKLAVGWSILYLLSRLYFARSGNLTAYVLYFLLLTHVMAIGFTMRPQIITYLFAAVLMFLLHRYFDGKSRIIYAVPPLMLLWVNMHGGVVAGLGLFGLATVVETIRCKLQNQPLPRPMLIALGLSLPAVLVNPYGVELWQFFIETIPRKRIITEWNPVPLLSPHLMPFKVLALLCFAGLVWHRPRRAWEIAIMLVALVFAFRHLRHTVLAGIILTLFVPLALAGWLDRFSGRVHLTAFAHNILAVALAGLTIYTGASHVSRLTADRFRMQVNPLLYPVYAVHFMKTNGINGNILNPFDWGEYLIWHLPESRVSTDGRYWTVYPDQVLKQNFVFHNEQGGWFYMLDLYPHEIILTTHNNQGMEQRKDWVKIYEDPVARIFIKDSVLPSKLLKRFRNKQLVYTDPPPALDFP